MDNILIGIIAGSIVALISFILGLFGQIWYGKLQEKSNRQKDALKKHFEDLEVDAIKPISEILGRITNSEGTLWGSGEGSFYKIEYFWPTKDFENGEFFNFKLHFPNQTGTAIRLINRVFKHNEICQSFIDKLKKLIEEKTHVPVVEGSQPPFLHSNVPVYVEKTLYRLALKKLSVKETANLEYDFRNARIDKKEGFWQLWATGTIYGHLLSEEQASLCKQSLIELTDSSSLIEEMGGIYSEAEWLESGARGLARILDFTCNQYGKYGKLLKQKKDCPVCQVIFERG